MVNNLTRTTWRETSYCLIGDRVTWFISIESNSNKILGFAIGTSWAWTQTIKVGSGHCQKEKRLWAKKLGLANTPNLGLKLETSKYHDPRGKEMRE